jgi:hypothetical protein
MTPENTSSDDNISCPNRQIDDWEMDTPRCDEFKKFVTERGGVREFGQLVAQNSAGDINEKSARRYIQRHCQHGSKMTSQMLHRYASAAKIEYLELHRRIILLKTPTAEDSSNPGKYSDESFSKGPSPRLNDFAAFFGTAVSDNQKEIQIYFPKRVLKKSAHGSAAPFDLDPECEFEFEDIKREDVWPEGITGLLSFDSVVAAIHLSTFFARKTGSDVWVRQENRRAVNEGMGSCVFSLGLGFSAVTHILEDKFKSPLFKIYCGHSPKKDFRHLTDHFRLKRELIPGSETPLPPPNSATTDGTDTIDIPKGKDIGLLLRVIPPTGSSKKSQPWFVCAGRTGTGTAAAAIFLTKNWKNLTELYAKYNKSLDRDSMALAIIHKEPLDSNDPRIGLNLTAEESGEMHYWDPDKKHPCLAFGVWDN